MFADVHPESFLIYAAGTVLLSLNLIFLWMYSTVVRTKSKVAVNPEDSALYKVPLEAQDPPAVARVLRAHTNAQANIFPFLSLSLVFVLGGGAILPTAILFGIFILSRLLHSYVYLKGKQPWRTIFFLIGLLATLVMMGEVICIIISKLG